MHSVRYSPQSPLRSDNAMGCFCCQRRSTRYCSWAADWTAIRQRSVLSLYNRLVRRRCVCNWSYRHRREKWECYAHDKSVSRACIENQSVQLWSARQFLPDNFYNRKTTPRSDHAPCLGNTAILRFQYCNHAVRPYNGEIPAIRSNRKICFFPQGRGRLQRSANFRVLKQRPLCWCDIHAWDTDQLFFFALLHRRLFFHRSHDAPFLWKPLLRLLYLWLLHVFSYAFCFHLPIWMKRFTMFSTCILTLFSWHCQCNCIQKPDFCSIAYLRWCGIGVLE